MRTLPWYPRDMGKYARDTSHLTMLEHGAYNLLLDYYYSNGGFQALLKHCSNNAELMPDHSRLYRICAAMTKQEQDAVDHVLKSFFKLDKARGYINPKADEVIEIQQEKHRKRVEAGRKGGAKQSSSNAKAKPKHKDQDQDQESKPPIIPHEGDGVEKVFWMEKIINDNALKRARANAPGWDMYHLMQVYSEGINAGTREKPRKPNAAFPSWCASYTKGKMP